MSILSWLFGNSAAEVEAARAAQVRAYQEASRFQLEQQRRWLDVNAMAKEGWRPCNTQSTEYMMVVSARGGLAASTLGDYPGLYEQIELRRLGEKETWVTHWSDIDPQMNIVDLWWRPVQVTEEYQRPIEGGKLKPEEPLALPAPETSAPSDNEKT